MADQRKKIMVLDCRELTLAAHAIYLYVWKHLETRDPGPEHKGFEYYIANPTGVIGEVITFRVWHTQTQINVRQLKG